MFIVEPGTRRSSNFGSAVRDSARTLEVKDLKVRWRTLRDTYIKKKREVRNKKSGSGAAPYVRWKYLEIMNFLEAYVQEASTDSNVVDCDISPDDDTQSQTQSQDYEWSSDAESEDGLMKSPPTPAIVPTRPKTPSTTTNTSSTTYSCGDQKTKKRKNDQMSSFESSFLELAKAQSSRLDQKCQEEKKRNPIDAFFESCSMRARELSKSKQAWLQMQVSMLLYTAESNDNLSSAPAHLQQHQSDQQPNYPQRPSFTGPQSQMNSNVFEAPTHSRNVFDIATQGYFGGQKNVATNKRNSETMDDNAIDTNESSQKNMFGISALQTLY